MAGNDLDLWIPRGADVEADDVPEYGHPDHFTIKVYHGGCIKDNKYVGGKVNFFDHVDKDKMSLVEVDNMVRQLDPAYEGQRIDYWYRIGSEDDALTKIETDLDALTMCCCVPAIRLVLLYLDHMELHGVYGDNLDVLYEMEEIFFSQARSSGVVIEELPDSPTKRPNCVIEEIPDEAPAKLPPRPAKRSTGVVIREVQDIVPTQQSMAASIGPNDKGKQKVDEGSNLQGSSGINFEDLQDIDILDYMQSYGGQGYQAHEEDTADDGSDGIGDDDDYNPEVDDEEYDAYGTDDDDVVMDGMEGDVAGLQIEVGGVGTSTQGSVLGSTEGFANLEDNEDMFGEVDSDEERMGPALNSDGEPEDEFPEFNPTTDMKRPDFCKGMKFANVRILRAALREKAIQGGWEYVYLKNDLQRLRVICKEDDCPFELYASKMQHENTLMIKTYESEHKCTRKWNNTMVRSRYLTSKFKDKIQLNENWNTASLAQTMSTKIKARVSKQMAYRAKRAALLELEGSIREQFARLPDYGRELQRVDPATTIDIKCDFSHSSNQPIFQRMYICLGALKNGFKAGCRAVIGLDGAHLKSAFGGQLLTAVGIDANNTTWVIAYAMVENETKDSWIWFLELLAKDLDINDGGAGWTFISDKQKGLMPAFDEVVPLAHIRFCVRHMWTNFTKLFPGKEMKDQMWKCAKATTMPFYLRDMEEMKQLDVNAYNWMTEPERPPKHWCRAFFNTVLPCDILINNLSESFNAWIRDARGKPPLSMFEEIRVKLMTRIQLRREKMQAYHGNICPKARKTLEKNKLKAATDCISTFNGGHQAEVENFSGSKNTVDLNLRTCSCRRWDLSGIPCKHAVSAIFQKREDPDDYIAECYLKKTYMTIYSNLIMPVNGMDLWTRGEGPAMLPPQYTRQPGRPKTKRIKDSLEKAQGSGTKLGRVQKSLKCGNCGILGHNVKTCHRHLPPKEKKSVTLNKRRKLNNGDGSQTQTKGKKATLTKNELRKKARETAEYQRKKMASLKASRAAGAKSASSSSRTVPPPPAIARSRPATSGIASSRPVQTSQASSKAVNPTRTSKRIQENSGKGGGK